MTALWIILGILAVLFLLSLLRVGVHVSFGETLRVTAIAGPVRLQILPKPDKPKKEKPKKEKPAKEPKEQSPKAKKERKLDFTAEDIKTLLGAVWTALKNVLRKTRQRLLIKPLHLSVAFGGALDPANAAETYGYANAAMWAAMPTLEKLTRMPDPQIHTEVNFEAEKTVVSGEVGLSFQIRDLFAIGGALLSPVIKWFFAMKKRKKLRDKAKAAEEKNAPAEKDVKQETAEQEEVKKAS